MRERPFIKAVFAAGICGASWAAIICLVAFFVALGKEILERPAGGLLSSHESALDDVVAFCCVFGGYAITSASYVACKAKSWSQALAMQVLFYPVYVVVGGVVANLAEHLYEPIWTVPYAFMLMLDVGVMCYQSLC